MSILDDTVRRGGKRREQTLFGTVKGNPGSNGQKESKKRRKKKIEHLTIM